MSHQFKPGDLAMIIQGPNSGACVELLRFHNSGDVKLGNGCWCEAHAPSWHVSGNSLVAAFDGLPGMHRVTHGLVTEKLLIPLRGDFEPAQQKAKEVV